MRSVKNSPQPEISSLARRHGFQTLAKLTLKHNSSAKITAASLSQRKRKASKEIWKDNSVQHPHSRQHVALFAGGEHSVAGPAELAEILPSTSPTAFIIQSSGAVDVSGNVATSSSSIQLATPAAAAIQQAPPTQPLPAPAPLPAGAPVAAATPQAPLPPAAAPAPAAAAAQPQGAAPAGQPSTTTTQAQDQGGSSWLGTFFMLLLFATVAIAGAAIFLKLRKDRNNSSRAGRLAGLLADEPGDSQFWKSAKTRQSKSRGSQFGSETEEETKSEETEDKKKGSGYYRDRRSQSFARGGKGEGEDSEADTSKSAYKKSRSRGSEAPAVDKKTSEEGDTGGSKRASDVGGTSTPPVSSYRGRRNQLRTSRSESRSASERSQSRSARNDQESNDIEV